MPKTTPYTIHFPNLPSDFNGFRIAHLSDLHNYPWGPGHRRVFQAVQRFDPHIVVMTGDMFDTRRSRNLDTLRLCKELARIYPVYFISGNHEQIMEQELRRSLYHKIHRWGVEILDNRCSSIYCNQASIRIGGLTIPLLYYKDPKRKPYRRDAWFSSEKITAILGEKHSKDFFLLLTHNPLYFPSCRDWGADLTLAGHIHGGIIDLPYFGPLLSPDVSLFPNYAAGHFAEQGHHLLVSRGLANTFALRVCNPMEVLWITLKREITAD